MMKKNNTLLYRFAAVLTVFGLALITLCGLVAYGNEAGAHRQESLEAARQVAEYLEDLILQDPVDFVAYRDFYVEHHGEMDVPYGFDDYLTARDDFDRFFRKAYQGKSLYADIDPGSMPFDLQLKYFTYRHEYWLLTFEAARESFGMPYTYFLLPDQRDYTVTYMIDGERTRREDDASLLYLGDTYQNPYHQHSVEWDAWITGEEPTEFHAWDNEWGRTYAYYDPLVIGGERIGLIVTEVEIGKVDHIVLLDTLRMAGSIAVVLLAGVAVLLAYIYRKYLRHIVMLTEDVRTFTYRKDPSIAYRIKGRATGSSELSTLAVQIAAMILELDGHVKQLLSTRRALNEAQVREIEASDLATKDALTGVRNKLAYDRLCSELDGRIAGGLTDVGIAMIDLNFLKRINDTYGHEKGDEAIRELCAAICGTFAHSPVFRVGGDEFVVVLLDGAYRNRDMLVKAFRRRLRMLGKDRGLQRWERVQAAVGVAVLDPESDYAVEDVFRRADAEMYLDKRRMKAARE